MKSLSLLFLLWSGEGIFWVKAPETTLPDPISKWSSIEFRMKVPTTPSSITTQKMLMSTTHSDGQTILQAEVTAYWSKNSENIENTAVKIMLKNQNTPIAECSFYFEPYKDQKFPGGACSGWLGSEQVGFTIRPK